MYGVGGCKAFKMFKNNIFLLQFIVLCTRDGGCLQSLVMRNRDVGCLQSMVMRTRDGGRLQSMVMLQFMLMSFACTFALDAYGANVKPNSQPSKTAPPAPKPSANKASAKQRSQVRHHGKS